MSEARAPLLRVEGLRKSFAIRKGLLQRAVGSVRAVDGVSFSVGEQETLGLVGESGCGKTTTGRALLRLVAADEGRIEFRSQALAPEGETRVIDVIGASDIELKTLRREMQIVFQDPFSSLNPWMAVEEIVAEPLVVHCVGSSSERAARIESLLEAVGLSPELSGRYPHELSGGQRQRVGIARALALDPRLIVADEPVSALDASVQAQVLNLLLDIQDQRGLSFVLIAHDLAVVRHMSDRVAVMYLGRIVETADTDELCERPLHPYTEALMAAVPVPDPDHAVRAELLEGDVPSASSPPAGCAFHPRCPHADDVCRSERPELADAGGGHLVACHLADTLDLRGLGD